MLKGLTKGFPGIFSCPVLISFLLSVSATPGLTTTSDATSLPDHKDAWALTHALHQQQAWNERDFDLVMQALTVIDPGQKDSVFKWAQDLGTDMGWDGAAYKLIIASLNNIPHDERDDIARAAKPFALEKNYWPCWTILEALPHIEAHKRAATIVQIQSQNWQTDGTILSDLVQSIRPK